MTAPKRLILIDGSGYIFRAYHAIHPLTDPSGAPVNAVLGFMNMMVKLMESNCPDYIAVIFDAARVTFRNRIYSEYKAHRPPAPEDLVPQFALVRDAADAMNIPRVEMADYEADDLIATYARMGVAAGMDVVILSSDKDLMQLVGNGIRLHDPVKDKPIGMPEVQEKFGVTPDRVRDVLALIGDSSDNVPGVPGIGPKTAAELVNQYGSLEGVLANTAQIKQPKRRETLEQNIDKARLSYELIGLCETVPVPAPLESLALRQPNTEMLFAFLQMRGFKNLMSRLQAKAGGAMPVVAPSPTAAPLPAVPVAEVSGPAFTGYSLVQDEAALVRWVQHARSAGVVAFDTETTGLDATRAELVGFSLCVEAGRAAYVPLGHVTGEGLFKEAVPGQIPMAKALPLLKSLLEDAGILKIGQNIKYDSLLLKSYGIEIVSTDDAMLLSYVLAAGLHGHGMDTLSERHLGHTPISYDAVTGTGKGRISFAEVPLSRACDYAAEDADVTFRLWQKLKPQVAAQKLLTLYETIERPLIPVLVAMESRGIRVNPQVLRGLSSDFAERMGALEAEIHADVGVEFNVGSPKQLGEILFDKLQLPGGKKSAKTGAYGTDNQVLEELAEAGHAIAEKVIEWRSLSKLKGTYTDALVEQINPKTGRVHTSFAMAIASTGRLSSSDPNLQNIPIRTTLGKKIRTAFIAAEGCKLISADYSQIELRLLAHMADIPTLKAAFKNGEDIHAITASQMFGVPVGEVSADLRRSAKTINFGIIYGMSAHGLATRLGIGRMEAASYIEQYFKQYPGIRDYMEVTKEFAREKGYVETLFGRRCHVPSIHDKNGARRQFAERAAINAPLQGTAADIIKRAMIALCADDRLQMTDDKAASSSVIRHPSSGLLLQVHDELIFEVPEAEADAALKLIKPAMENAAHLSVPLTVEAGVGDNWGEIH